MKQGYRAKITNIMGEVMLSAADSELIGSNLREGILHIEVMESFYGNINVTEEFLMESMEICTIGNFVGKRTVDLAVKKNIVNPENIITISKIPHAQYAKMLR
jgi:hypothetical protein